MNHDNYDDNYIRGILNDVKSIAMVGASPVDVRPSYFAFKYLVQRGLTPAVAAAIVLRSGDARLKTPNY